MTEISATGRGPFLQEHQVGVPRRFAVGAMLAVTTIYCVLLRLLTLADVPIAGIIVATLFVTAWVSLRPCCFADNDREKRLWCAER